MLSAKKIHKEKITLNLIHDEYSKYIKKTRQNFFLDLLQLKKRLEELQSCNLISIKSDEKYTDLFELKTSLEETKELLENLYSQNINKMNFDSEMHRWLHEVY